ncbi:MAG: molybdenum cofactor guanylyltransferase [Defluviitaleaceae bacterium]|nr:molybdenum cofactor guanylyltransferase [Defluviitaleaceae bacterium]
MKMFGDAVILCGGKSSRMGFDKSLLKIDGEYVINIMSDKLGRIFDRVSLCANGSGKFEKFGLPIITDIHNDGIGPVAAVHSALRSCGSQYVFVVAVDMPLLNLELIRHMMQVLEAADPPPLAFAPETDGYLEATHAFYSINALGYIEKQIDAGNFAVNKILKGLDAMRLDEGISRSFDADLTMFTNLNYAEDLDKIGGYNCD